MAHQHQYSLTIEWTGNKGAGTTDYTAYERSHTIHVDNKVVLDGSADKPFRGDETKHNPEDLLLASLTSCHMLWYLHLCADNGVVVLEYKDHSEGTMEVDKSGIGKFAEAILKPEVRVAESVMIEKAKTLHDEAHKKCFIANSCNFPIKHQAVIFT